MQLPDPETCRALARAVVDAKKWAWLPGMQGLAPEAWGSFRVLKVQDGEVVAWLFTGTEGAYVLTDHDDGPFDSWTPTVPDFTDPLTAAGALMVAREVRKFPGLYCAPNPHPNPAHAWIAWGGPVGGHDFRMCGSGPTELEALIAAILAAPETKP